MASNKPGAGTRPDEQIAVFPAVMNSLRPLISIRVLLCLVFARLQGNAFAGGEYMKFPETISPDGAYCLAWGLENKDSKVWTEVPYGDELDYEGDVLNLLVDVEGKRVIATIPEFGYFANGKVRQNRHGLEVGWAPDSRNAIAIYDGRYGYEAAAWIDAAGGKVVNVGPHLEKILRGLARQKHGKKAESERTYMSFRRPVFTSSGVLFLDATLYGFISKFEDAGEDFRYRVKIKAERVSKKQGFELITSSDLTDKEILEEQKLDDAELETELNKRYAAFRSALDPAGRDKLKAEELRWLRLREAMPTEQTKQEFTRRRVSELRTRAEGL